ncbi:M10 family metallopeptidase C-terminal domain-containing protein [Inquilinus limosus]|uniref:calcium-binding protein n=1 Tax=Inquilinus limosus TaxID=171674 RepID=UPI003F14B0E2
MAKSVPAEAWERLLCEDDEDRPVGGDRRVGDSVSATFLPAKDAAKNQPFSCIPHDGGGRDDEVGASKRPDWGNDSDEELSGSDRKDEIYGQGGNDVIHGHDGDDKLHGGEGNDAVYGDSGEDTLTGGTGNDTLKGGGDDDILYGEYGDAAGAYEGNDMLYGEGGNDKMMGEKGADTLSGGAGLDSLWGGDGNDLLEGGAGGDTLDGGAGVDTVSYADSAGGVTIRLVDRFAAGADAANDKLASIENVIGSNYGDTLAGDEGANVLTGGLDKDVLIGGAGTDRFVYTAPEDSMGENRDIIEDFSRGEDLIDLTRIDADIDLEGDQAFSFIGADAFEPEKAGQLRCEVTADGNTLIEGDVDGDGQADFDILLQGQNELAKPDFLL